MGFKKNGDLSLDAATKLQYNMKPDYFNINVSNQLSPAWVLASKRLTSGQGFPVDATTKILNFAHFTVNTNQFFITPILFIGLNATGGIIDSIIDVGSGLQIKLADTILLLFF